MEEFIKQISQKFGYDKELQSVIKTTISLMIDEYGQENLESILNLFSEVRIFLTEDMSHENLKSIKDKIVPKDERIIETSNDIYGTDQSPGSVYNYETIFDDQMSPIGEYRWIVVEDLKGNYKEEKYQETFGTSINFPYFLHEINHAYNMQNPKYQKRENKISTKHGMFEEKFILEQKQNKVAITPLESRNIIVEEAINENQTQRMLCRYLNIQDYSNLRQKLNSIGHVPTQYDGTLIFLADTFEKLIGKERLLSYRKDNNKSIIEEFDKKLESSKIANKYGYATNGYEIFGRLCGELFNLKSKCYTYSLEEYRKIMAEITAKAMGPLYAYDEVTLKRLTLEEYENRVNAMVNQQEQKTV